MPLYEYTCIDCGNRFDALRKMTEADDPIECTECRCLHTTRSLSLFFASVGNNPSTSKTSSGCAGCSANSCAGCGR